MYGYVYLISDIYMINRAYAALSMAQNHDICEIVKIGSHFLLTKKKHCYLYYILPRREAPGLFISFSYFVLFQTIIFFHHSYQNRSENTASQ